MLKRTDLKLNDIKELKRKIKKLKEVYLYLSSYKKKIAFKKIQTLEKEIEKLTR